MAIVYGLRKLPAGSVVDVDFKGKATFLTCNWLIEVPNGNPEPDSIEDTYDIVECGARFRVHPNYPDVPLGDALLCDNGHDRLACYIDLAPGGPAWQREQMDRRAELEGRLFG